MSGRTRDKGRYDPAAPNSYEYLRTQMNVAKERRRQDVLDSYLADARAARKQARRDIDLK